jgi:hypothetical protein
MTTRAIRSAGTSPTGGSRMRWVLGLVGTGVYGQTRAVDIMEFNRPDCLEDIAKLGLTLAEGKQVLARAQQEVVAAQVGNRAGLRPACCTCNGRCHVKDWRLHRIATLFGEVRIRLPRFLCAGCGHTETGVSWPSHCRSTPALDQLQARLSALKTYRVAADVLLHLLPIDAGKSHETLRSHTLQLGDAAQISQLPGQRQSRSAWIRPSFAAAKRASATWRSASATSRPLPEGDRRSQRWRRPTLTLRG